MGKLGLPEATSTLQDEKGSALRPFPLMVGSTEPQEASVLGDFPACWKLWKQMRALKAH